jgi:transposase-like protein
VEYVHRRRDDGYCQAEVARELGLTQRTIWGWVRQAQHDVVKLVELVDDEPVTTSEGRTLVLPGGSRIEGLSIDDVLALVRALS